jgi:hypothetical protein
MKTKAHDLGAFCLSLRYSGTSVLRYCCHQDAHHHCVPMSILHLTLPHPFPTINPFKIRCTPSCFSHAFTLSATR